VKGKNTVFSSMDSGEPKDEPQPVVAQSPLPNAYSTRFYI
jgi:hypothetical protein